MNKEEVFSGQQVKFIDSSIGFQVIGIVLSQDYYIVDWLGYTGKFVLLRGSKYNFYPCPIEYLEAVKSSNLFNSEDFIRENSKVITHGDTVLFKTSELEIIATKLKGGHRYKVVEVGLYTACIQPIIEGAKRDYQDHQPIYTCLRSVLKKSL